jgi:hypothetical protein
LKASFIAVGIFSGASAVELVLEHPAKIGRENISEKAR